MKIHRPSIGCFLFSIAFIVMAAACTSEDGDAGDDKCGNNFCDEIASSCPEDCEVDGGEPDAGDPDADVDGGILPPEEVDAGAPDAMPQPHPQPPVCNNTICERGETVDSCPADCSVCGDTRCTGPETRASCPVDCSVCGDGVCTGNETPATCSRDCERCGDGLCTGRETATSCSSDCQTCGDGVCTGTETTTSCPSDCTGQLLINNYSSYTVYTFHYMPCSLWPGGPWSGDQLREYIIRAGASFRFYNVTPGCYYFQARGPGTITWTTSSPLRINAGQTSTFNLYN